MFAITGDDNLDHAVIAAYVCQAINKFNPKIIAVDSTGYFAKVATYVAKENNIKVKKEKSDWSVALLRASSMMKYNNILLAGKDLSKVMIHDGVPECIPFTA